ncbi:MAG: hypothetical protein AAGA55_10955 [Planctomycetota bacterium]
MQHTSRFAAIALMASLAIGGPTAPDTKVPPPWPDGAGVELVVDDAGEARIEMPPVSDGYIDGAPLDDIARWVSRQWSDRASKIHFHRHAASGATTTPGDVVIVRPLRLPLNDDQWDRFAHRVAAALGAADEPTRDAGFRGAGFLLFTVPVSEAGPGSGTRAIGDVLWEQSHARDAFSRRGFPGLLVGFTGGSGIHRRVIDRLARSTDPEERLFLGEVLSSAASAEHALGDAESAAIAAVLLELADENRADRRRSISMAIAAFSTVGYSGTSVPLIERSLSSPNPSIRMAALRHATDVIRHARQHNDRATSRAMAELHDGFVSATMSDPDERSSSIAVGTLWALLETRPGRAVDAMVSALDAPHDMTIAMACMYMAEHPRLVKPHADKLREIASAGAADASQAAAELLHAIANE